MSKLSKECKCCGRDFFKRERDSVKQWDGRIYCSISCRNKDTKPIPVHIRFWKYVSKTEGCWVWTGTTDGHGYGSISLSKYESPMKAYRLSYEMHHGPIPSGLVVRHKCDNPICVNPEHLEVGTHKDNSMDASIRGRLNPKSLENLNHDTALTLHQVREIESMEFVSINGRGKGRKVQDVAKEYGVCKSIITQIKKGEYVLSTKKAKAA